MLPPSHPLSPVPLLWGAVAMVPSNSCIRHAQVAHRHIAWSVQGVNSMTMKQVHCPHWQRQRTASYTSEGTTAQGMPTDPVNTNAGTATPVS